MVSGIKEGIMKLYHYTSLGHLLQIFSNGQLKLTPSNLLRTKNIVIVNGEATDPTDKYKPVVWFTDLLDFDKAINCGLKSEIDKTAVAIEIDTDNYSQSFEKWDKWAVKNGIDKYWFSILKKTAPQWKTFYITEKPVTLDEETGIIYKTPEIRETFWKALQELDKKE